MLHPINLIAYGSQPYTRSADNAARFTTGTPRIWPDHWAGGSKSWYPNRAFLKMVQEDGREITTCFIEHHGAGEGDDRRPTDEDYANLRLYAHATRMVDELEAIAGEYREAARILREHGHTEPSEAMENRLKSLESLLASVNGRAR